MKIKEHRTEIEITDIKDFDLKKTFECGQCFRWNVVDYDINNINNCTYKGIAFGNAIKIRHNNGSIFISGTIEEFKSIWCKYFDLDRDYATIRKQLCIDSFMEQATEYGRGIRILHQDKWEALCSFIISQNNNIPRIKTIIETLCREFGDAIMFRDELYYTFPSAGKIAALNTESLAVLRCGYRAEYIIRSAKAITDGLVNLNELAECTPEIARKELKKLHGVGDKVADCVMLFGLNMLDAFPLDVWMKKAVAKHYGPNFDPIIFSPYAGIAQQYIFNYTRNN